VHGGSTFWRALSTHHFSHELKWSMLLLISINNIINLGWRNGALLKGKVLIKWDMWKRLDVRRQFSLSFFDYCSVPVFYLHRFNLNLVNLLFLKKKKEKQKVLDPCTRLVDNVGNEKERNNSTIKLFLHNIACCNKISCKAKCPNLSNTRQLNTEYWWTATK
jgi:hypothetical protein